MAWTIADIPPQDGRVAVVTGANGGLGLATARALASSGAHVVMAARNQDKAFAARDEILRAHPGAGLAIVPLDLGSQASIETAAAQILHDHPVIDLLVNNAGLMAMPERQTEDGYEMQLGVNHLGHWALTARLLPALLRADAARVVTVTSVARLMGRTVDPADPHLRAGYGAWNAYGQSKLANYVFGVGLQREFAARGLHARSLVAHPGLTHSELQVKTVEEGGGGWSAGLWAWLARTAGMPVERGSLPQLRAATDPRATGRQMYGPRYLTLGPAVARPLLRPGLDRAIETLWQVSERETGLALDVDAASATG
jgi:NAD(P)-dependent dehydrogenase (short-subunit alcohol dehydrogenase family)